MMMAFDLICQTTIEISSYSDGRDDSRLLWSIVRVYSCRKWCGWTRVVVLKMNVLMEREGSVHSCADT